LRHRVFIKRLAEIAVMPDKIMRVGSMLRVAREEEKKEGDLGEMEKPGQCEWGSRPQLFST
jgi:hypothetical protein